MARSLAIFMGLCLLGMGLAGGCRDPHPGADYEPEIEGPRGRIILYSPHGKEHVVPCLERFNAKYPMLRVYFLDLPSAKILERVRAESGRPQADLWWGGPQTMFMEASARELLAPYRPSWAEAVAPAHRAADDTWMGTYLTPEVIMYNTRQLTPEEAPQDWDDLLDPKWRGRIVLRDPLPSGTMRTIFAGLVWRHFAASGSPEAGFEWLRRLEAQEPVYAATPALMYQHLASGETPITLWNMPDVFIQSQRNGYPFGMVIPSSGTPVLVEGIALIRGAPNADGARILYEFLTSEEELLYQARELHRLPARRDLPAEQLPAWMHAPIKEMPLDWERFGPLTNEWLEHWRHHIRRPR